MKKKLRKNIKQQLALNAIHTYFKTLKEHQNPNYHKNYVQEILKISKSFNIRLSREDKQKFCKKCSTYFSVQTREIRLNPKNNCKEIICKNCGEIKRYKYK